MGKSQRTKGHDWERAVATAYREKWPQATVRRALQAHRPFEPDVVVEGDAPPVAVALWTECFCSSGANDATVATKLAQAERDVEKAKVARPKSTGFYRLPVVVWKRTGGRQPNVTLRLWSLLFATGEAMMGGDPVQVHDVVITLSLKEFLWALP